MTDSAAAQRQYFGEPTKLNRRHSAPVPRALRDADQAR